MLQLSTWLRGSTLRRMLMITAVWRLVIAIVGIVAHSLLAVSHFNRPGSLRIEHWPQNPLTVAVDAGIRYDALWYARIALHGYTYSTHHQSSIAFYPLYPILIKVLSLVVGNVYVAGMLLSTVFLFLAVVLLFHWCNDIGLREHAVWATLLLLLFPWAFFYAAMYTESLYLALALAAFIALERRHYGWAAVCAFLIALSRPTGILLVPCLAVLLYLRHVRTWRAWSAPVAGVLGLAAFSFYQLLAFGTSRASANAAAVPPWSRGLGQVLSDLQLHARHLFPSWYLAFMLAVAILMLLPVPLVYRRLGPAYALYAVLVIVLPAASGLISIQRYAVVDFPVFVALATVRNRLVPFALLLIGTIFLVFFTAAFEAGWVWGVF